MSPGFLESALRKGGMTVTTKMWLRLGAAWLACALAACGGGGGGDSVQVTSDRSSLTLVGVNGSMAPSAPITFTLTGGSGTYYGVALSDNDAFVASFEPLTDTSALVRMQAVTPLPAGTQSSGRITFKLCSDQNCAKTVWSQQIPYTMTMFSVDTSPVTLVGSEGAVSETVSRVISPADTSGVLDFRLDGDRNISVSHSNSASVDFSGSGVGVAAGSYNATLEIGAKVDGVFQGFLYGTPVSFTVGSGLVAPAAAPFDVVATSTEASLVGHVPVRFAGTQSPAWSASSDSDWLVLDTASGTGPSDISYHVDVAKLAAMVNWDSQTAQVTITSPGLTSVTFPVTLNKHLPEVTMVTPSGVVSGQAVAVRVSGRGLSQLSGSASFRVGATTPTSVSIESDTSATLQLPALPAGASTLRAVSTLGDTGVPYATIGATPAGTFAATSVVNSGEKRAAVFDPSRNAVFATNVSQDTLVRYQLSGGSWTVTGLPVANIGLLALAPDRRTVYVVSGSQLLAVDPDTMSVRRRYDAGADLAGGFYFSTPLALTSNLRLWVGGDQWSSMGYFDLRRGSFGGQDIDSGSLYSPVFFAPADGRSMYVDNPLYLSPPLPNYWYDTASDSVTSPAGQPIANGDVSLDARGTLALIDSTSLYRVSDWSLMGKAEVTDAPNGGFGWRALLSPDGRRIYREVSDSGDVVDHIDVFDATQVIAGQSQFVKVGSIPLPVKAVGCNVQNTYLCDGPGRLVIDPTGTTLFWVGGAKMVVIPVPESLSGASLRGAQVQFPSRLRKAIPAYAGGH